MFSPPGGSTANPNGQARQGVLDQAPTPAELELSTIDRLRETIAFPNEWRLLR